MPTTDLRDDPDASYQALTAGIGAVAVERGAVRVTGPESVSFLQGQLSQDVESLRPGRSAWSFLLQPQGKVQAWLRVTRIADDGVVLDVDAGFEHAVLARLERFKLRTKAELAVVDGVACLSVRGPGSSGVELPAGVGPPLLLAVPAEWPELDGTDIVTIGEAAVSDLRTADGHRVPMVDPRSLDAVRIECGVPRLGAELTDETIPAEAGSWVIDRSVSFTKGCYTGQELVARVDSRGSNVPRPVRGLVIESDEDDLPGPGDVVTAGGDEVGRLTSVAWSPGQGAAVALAPVRRTVEPGAEVRVGDTGRTARVVAIPFPGWVSRP